MNLRQLEYLVVIAEEGSFTRASERLLVAQPSLSQQIGALEAELGGPLLERLPRGVRPTMAGQNFLPEARAAISHANRARRSVRMALSLESGQLEIATITSAAAGILPSALRRWQELHPRIQVSLSEYLHRRLLDEAVRGAIKNRLTFAVERWGGSGVLFGWDLWNEIHPAHAEGGADGFREGASEAMRRHRGQDRQEPTDRRR